MFVDRSGRRRRVVIATGATAGVLVVLALSLLVAGLFGASPIPLPGLPDLGGPAPAPPVTTAGPDATSGPGSTATPDPSALSATPDPTRRHVPTQTPTDRGRPTRS